MSPLKISVFAALASAAVTAGCLFYFHHRRAQEAGFLRYQNGVLLYKAHQRRHSGSPTVPSPGAAAASEPAADAGPPPAGPATAGRRSVEVYRNEGQATPRATVQTFAWACDRGDTATIEKMLWWEGGSRKKAEAFLAGLPAETRAQWKSADEMVAAELAFINMVHPFPNADILEAATFEQIREDRFMFRLPGTRKDRTEFQHTDEGWKYVVTEAMVDICIAEFAAQQTPAR
jgi:hypothetical protein